MQASATDLRKGYLVTYQDRICTVSDWRIMRNDRRQYVFVTLKDLETGRVTELKENSDTKFELLEKSNLDLSHSYSEGHEEVFYDAAGNEFLGALTFTMIYTFTTLPFVLVIGFLLALGVNNVTNRLKGMFITASLLPFIITPVVAALSIKWLFRDNGLVPYLLSHVGIEVFWMAQAWSARLLIIVYGIWHVVPFAFIVLYAGLQSVPQDALEAATIDGATRWQKLRYVTVPHLMPLIVFITLIHLMDAYRVFEPVIVLTQGAFTTSVQYLTYHILLLENNPYKASAAAVLTLAGIVVLLIPLLVRTWREQKGGV